MNSRCKLQKYSPLSVSLTENKLIVSKNFTKKYLNLMKSNREKHFLYLILKYLKLINGVCSSACTTQTRCQYFVSPGFALITAASPFRFIFTSLLQLVMEFLSSSVITQCRPRLLLVEWVLFKCKNYLNQIRDSQLD